MTVSLSDLRRRIRIAAIAVVAAATLVFSALPSTAAAGVAGRRPAQPGAQGPALQQLDWLIGASARLPVPATEIEQHIAPQTILALGGPASINSQLAVLGTLTFRQVVLDEPDLVHVIVTGSNVGTFDFELQTDTAGLILIAEPMGVSQVPPPASWQELDTDLAGLAPEVSFAAMTIGPDGCHLVHGVNATTARPLGSSFKLYVLGALARAVRRHRASWGQELAIRDQWKSLPSGLLQNVPAGTRLTLREYADFMLSLSDNTAADHLIHFVGRDAVQAQLFRFGNADPGRDIPFLTTRELFALKSVNYPALADSYLADSPAQRTAMLPALDQIPLSQLSGWAQPELINQIEWFASPADICRAYAGLWHENAQPGMSAIGGALSINDGGIGLDRDRYPVVWFKGGSEPGVVTLNYLARASDGQVIVASVMLADPDAPISGTAELQALAVARGGIQLATRQVAARLER